jgi:hypothetical protein
MKAIFSKLERVPLRDAWKHESQEFPLLLAEGGRLVLLADAIGLSHLDCSSNAHPIQMVHVPANLGRGNRLTQRRGDVNDRKAISDVRKFLKSYVMPLSDDPFREFEDGWGIKFTVNDQIGRRQVKAIEDDEFTNTTNNDSPFNYQDDIDLVELSSFSIRKS